MSKKKLRIDQAYFHVPTQEYRWIVNAVGPAVTWKRINPSNGKLSPKPIWGRVIPTEWKEVEFEIAVKVKRIKTQESSMDRGVNQ